MHRFWNLKTQFMAVMVFLLLGALLLQNYVQERNEDRLLAKFQNTAQDIADEVTQSVVLQVRQVQSLSRSRRQRTRDYQSPAPYEIRINVTEVQRLFGEELDRTRQENRLEAATLNALIEAITHEFNRGLPSALEGLEFTSLDVLSAEVSSPRSDDGAVGRAVLAEVHEGDRPHEGVSDEDATDLEAWRVDPPAAASVGEADSVFPLAEHEGTELGAHSEEGSATRYRTRRPRPSADTIRLEPARIFVTPDRSALASSMGGDPTRLDISGHLRGIQSLFEEYRRIDLVATLGIFLCGIAAALYLGFRITRPVYQVVDAFERVSHGDLDTCVETSGSGEFVTLGEQFNRMVASLKENRNLEQELVQRERVQHMGDLAAGVAHDVRNPLNAIHLNIGQIRDEFLPDNPESRARFLRFTSDIQSEVERLNRLVGNFLSLAQPSSTAAESVSPKELVDELRRLLQKEAVERKVELVVDAEPNLPVLMWDRQEMKSAFLNVAMNALQAMEPEGGRLTVHCAADPEDPRRVKIRFTDSGRGIHSRDLERIFIPYFTTRTGGTGLGMSIARKIAERNGGRIEVASRPGEGTTVEFSFHERDELF